MAALLTYSTSAWSRSVDAVVRRLLKESHPLISAVQKFDDDVVKAIVATGVDLNLVDKNGKSAMSWAITIKDKKIQKTLADAGAIDTEGLGVVPEGDFESLVKAGTIKDVGKSFYGESLSGENFRGIDLTGANFEEADLSKVDFTGAILKNAFFSNTNLENAIFKEANLEGAYFLMSDLRGANFKGAALSGARFWQTIQNHKTKFSFDFSRLKGVTKKEIFTEDNSFVVPAKDQFVFEMENGIRENYHDKFVRSVYSQENYRLDIFKLALTPTEFDLFDWSTLKAEVNSFVSQELEENRMDLIFLC